MLPTITGMTGAPHHAQVFFKHFCRGWTGIVILPISASCVGGMICAHYWLRWYLPRSAWADTAFPPSQPPKQVGLPTRAWLEPGLSPHFVMRTLLLMKACNLPFVSLLLSFWLSGVPLHQAFLCLFSDSFALVSLSIAKTHIYIFHPIWEIWDHFLSLWISRNRHTKPLSFEGYYFNPFLSGFALIISMHLSSSIYCYLH
jgi:hypothetical protein